MNPPLKKSDLKVATKEEAFWIKAKAETEVRVKGLKSALKFELATMEMVNSKLKEAKKEKT